MTTVNLYQRFKRLLPQTYRYTVTVDSHNGDGTSNGTTRSGNTVVVEGEIVAIGDKALVENGRILRKLPVLTEYIESV